MGQELVRMDHKRLEQTVFSWRKLHFLFAKSHCSTDKIHGEITCHKGWTAILLTNAPQGGPDSRQQFSRPKRLREVVVGACI